MNNIMKYKLKKWYPSLPDYWKPDEFGIRPDVVVYKTQLSGRNTLFYKSENDPTNLSIRQVENNPEFWEKIEGKDYEILKTISNEKNNIVGQGVIVDYFTDPYSGIFNNPYWDIYSVKRLSDGEVFTLGDNVEFKSDNPRLGTHSGEIKSIKQIDGDIDIKVGMCVSYLEYVEHRPNPKPLFTTKDGVDIYEGDRCYVVSKDHFQTAHYTMSNDEHDGALYIPHKNVYFYNQRKAHEYVKNNKPYYSKAQVEEALNEFKGKAIFQRAKFRRKLDELKEE